MRKRFSVPLLFLLLTLTSRAQLPLDQQRFADSLNNILQHATSDSLKARASFTLIYFWVSRDTVKARQYLDQGRKLSKAYPYLEGVSYAHEGYFYYATDAAKSEAAYLKADSLLSRFTTQEAYIARSNIWANLGALQQRKDDDRAYIDIVLNKAIPIALLAADTALVGSQYVGVATAFMNLEQYDKAAIYLNKAIRIFKTINTQISRLVAAYNRAGENYIFLKKFPEAKAVLDTLKIILRPYPASELNAGYYMVKGMYHHELKQYDSALASFDKGIAAANGPNKAYRIQEIQFYTIKTLNADKKYEQARQLLLQLSADEELMSLADSRLEIYSGMADAYAGLGQLNTAYAWQKKYSQLSDSLHESSLKDHINEMEIKYQNAEKEKEIVVLKAKNEQAEYAARNSRLMNWLLASASLFLLIVAIFALLYYRNNKKLSAQKDINHQQQLRELEQQQQLATTRAMLEGEERERQRVARDLHDGLGGMLAGIKIKLSGQSTMENPPSLDGVILQLDHSVSELRRIARNMMPESLLKFGLETALKDLCESLGSSETQVEFQAYNIEKNLSISVQVTIYRIAQEILSNAIRHAQASQVVLQCSQNENTFLITAEDNGKGFDAAAITDNPGIGFSNIKSRVEYLKGKMETVSAPGEGTTINIELNVAI